MNPYRIGIVSEVDPEKCTVRVTFPAYDEMVSPPLRVLVPSTRDTKHFYLPTVNSQVVVLLADDGAEGVVLGSIYTQRDPTDGDLQAEGVSGVVFGDGSRVIYDEGSSTLTIDSRSDVVVTVDQDCTIDATRNGELNSGTTQVKVAPGGVTVKKGGTSLKSELVALGNALAIQTHPTSVGPTGPPVNAAAFTNFVTAINLLFEA